jgi:hypothetical protein
MQIERVIGTILPLNQTAEDLDGLTKKKVRTLWHSVWGFHKECCGCCGGVV